jgi:hypothetical protein
MLAYGVELGELIKGQESGRPDEFACYVRGTK